MAIWEIPCVLFPPPEEANRVQGDDDVEGVHEGEVEGVGEGGVACLIFGVHQPEVLPEEEHGQCNGRVQGDVGPHDVGVGGVGVGGGALSSEVRDQGQHHARGHEVVNPLPDRVFRRAVVVDGG